MESDRVIRRLASDPVCPPRSCGDSDEEADDRGGDPDAVCPDPGREKVVACCGSMLDSTRSPRPPSRPGICRVGRFETLAPWLRRPVGVGGGGENDAEGNGNDVSLPADDAPDAIVPPPSGVSPARRSSS